VNDPAYDLETLVASLDQVEDAIAIHRDFHMLYCNLRYAQMYGVDTVEQALRHPSQWTRIPRVHWDRARDEYVRLMAGENLGVRRIGHLDRDGSLVWIEIEEWRIEYQGRPAAEVHLRDVTAVMPVNDEEVKLRNVLQHLADGFMLVGANGRISFTNQRFHEIFPSLPDADGMAGMALESTLVQMVDNRYLGRMPEYVQRDVALAILERFRAPQGDAFRLEIDGRWFEAGVTPCGDGGTIVTFRAVHEDHVAAETLIESEMTLRLAIDRFHAEHGPRSEADIRSTPRPPLR
jgi:PAS domain S-box-containing protein